MHGHCRKRGPAKTMQILSKQRTIFNKNFQVIRGFICELKLLSPNTNYRNANLLTKTQKKFQIHGQKVLKNATRGSSNEKNGRKEVWGNHMEQQGRYSKTKCNFFILR